MRFVRFITTAGEDAVGVEENDHVIHLKSSFGSDPNPILPLLGLSAQDRGAILHASRHRTINKEEVRLLSPLARPGKVLAVARGYLRTNEKSVSEDATRYLFMKRSDGVLGPSDSIPLASPAVAVVAEIEIALVLAQRARHVTKNSALSYVGGYTIANDVSARELDMPPAGRRDQHLDGFMDWLNGKWLDGFLALGPSIVTPDEWSDNGDRRISTLISGTSTVIGSTARLTHGFDEIVASASDLMTLHPGDVILTGMPETPKPERHLNAGDVVQGEVEGLGVLVNPVVAESDGATSLDEATTT